MQTLNWALGVYQSCVRDDIVSECVFVENVLVVETWKYHNSWPPGSVSKMCSGLLHKRLAWSSCRCGGSTELLRKKKEKKRVPQHVTCIDVFFISECRTSFHSCDIFLDQFVRFCSRSVVRSRVSLCEKGDQGLATLFVQFRCPFSNSKMSN